MAEAWRYRRITAGGEISGQSGHSGNRLWSLLAILLVLLAVVSWAFRPRSPERAERKSVTADQISTGGLVSSDRPATIAGNQLPSDLPVPTTAQELIEEARREARQLCQEFPEDWEAFDLAGRFYRFVGDMMAARDAWKRSTELNRKNTSAYENLGATAALQGDYDAAAEWYRKSLEREPHSASAAVRLADVLAKLGKLPQAVDVLDAARAANPSSAEVLLLLGQVHLQLRDYAAAKAAFDQALHLNPELQEAHFGLGTALMRLGEPESARPHLQKFRELKAAERLVPEESDPERFDLAKTSAHISAFYTYAANVYSSGGMVREAERLWRRAAALNPKNLACRMSLGTLYVRTGQSERAIEVYEQLAAAEPDNALHFWQLGTLHAQAGKLDLAEANISRVIELAPEIAKGHAGLAEIYLRTGRDPNLARRLAQRAVEIEPNAPHYDLLSRACDRAGDRSGAIAAARQAQRLSASARKGGGG